MARAKSSYDTEWQAKTVSVDNQTEECWKLWKSNKVQFSQMYYTLVKNKCSDI